MKIIRTTIVTAKPGYTQQVASLLKDLGEYTATQPGFIEDYTFDVDGKLGRISVWDSHEAADRAAMHVHTIALRSQIYNLTLPDRQEGIAVISGEHHQAKTLAAA